MILRNFFSSSPGRRLALGGIATLACLLLVADPSFARGRFGGGGGRGVSDAIVMSFPTRRRTSASGRPVRRTSVATSLSTRGPSVRR